jgi:hypothetical protein
MNDYSYTALRFTPALALLLGIWLVLAPASLRSQTSSRVPLFIGAAYDIEPINNRTPDMGETADQNLMRYVLVNQQLAIAPLPFPCHPSGSPTGCQIIKYSDVLRNHCNTQEQKAVYAWANANDEAAFLHVYSNQISAGSRLTSASERGCEGGKPVYFNPADADFNSYLYSHVWTNTSRFYYPNGYGVYEDNSTQTGQVIVGIASPHGLTSEEFSNGWNSGRTGFADRVGNGRYAHGVDYQTALAYFVNGACRAVCLPVVYNGGAPCCGDIKGCAVVEDGRCHDPYFANFVDDQFTYTNLCANVRRGNLLAIDLENVFMHKRREGRYPVADTQTLIGMINSFAGFVRHTSDGCRNTVLSDFEYGFGPGGPGDITGGIEVRTLALAMRWLVPDPDTGVPDRIIPHYGTIGGPIGTADEAPYYFEETFVPHGPLKSVSPFVWNGRTPTVGGGCDGVAADRHGASDLRVQCVGTAGIYCQQYRNLFINGTNYGPTAACVNTSTSGERIVPSWFIGNSMSTYKYELALSGGELRSVPDRNVPGGSISLPTCSNAAYCTGSTNLAAQTVKIRGEGSDTLCGQCGVVLLSRD